MVKNTKGVTRIRKSRKDRQHNGQSKRTKGQTTIYKHKHKDRVTRTPLKTGCELRCFGGVSGSCSTSDTRRDNLGTNPVISHE